MRDAPDTNFDRCPANRKVEYRISGYFLHLQTKYFWRKNISVLATNVTVFQAPIFHILSVRLHIRSRLECVTRFSTLLSVWGGGGEVVKFKILTLTPSYPVLQMEAGPLLYPVREPVRPGRHCGREAEALRRQQPRRPLAQTHRRHILPTSHHLCNVKEICTKRWVTRRYLRSFKSLFMLRAISRF